MLSDLRDLPAAVERCRRLIDADCDPVAVDRVLGKHQLLADSVAANPGLRVPGTVDGDEIAVRAVLGQQVSVAGATTTAAKLVARYGEPVDFAIEGLTHLFPSAVAVAEIDPTELPIPRARANALVGLCQALRDGEIALDRSLTGPRCGGDLWHYRVSADGPLTTSHCARSETRMCSCRPTSARVGRFPER